MFSKTARKSRALPFLSLTFLYVLVLIKRNNLKAQNQNFRCWPIKSNVPVLKVLEGAL